MGDDRHKRCIHPKLWNRMGITTPLRLLTPWQAPALIWRNKPRCFTRGKGLVALPPTLSTKTLSGWWLFFRGSVPALNSMSRSQWIMNLTRPTNVPNSGIRRSLPLKQKKLPMTTGQTLILPTFPQSPPTTSQAPSQTETTSCHFTEYDSDWEDVEEEAERYVRAQTPRVM